MNRIISEELKPCPFCGSEAEYMNYGPEGQMVRCSECCAIVDKDTKELAFQAWNTRPIATTLDGIQRWDFDQDTGPYPLDDGDWVKFYDLANHHNAVQVGWEAIELAKLWSETKGQIEPEESEAVLQTLLEVLTGKDQTHHFADVSKMIETEEDPRLPAKIIWVWDGEVCDEDPKPEAGFSKAVKYVRFDESTTQPQPVQFQKVNRQEGR